MHDFNSGAGASLCDVAESDLRARRFKEARTNLTRAIEWQRKALATNPDYDIYRNRMTTALSDLILAVRGLGLDDEAAEARRELDVLDSSDPKLMALDARLTAVLKGKETVKDENERTQLADRAYRKSLPALSARLYAEALSKAPGLADDLQAHYRFKAACAAAQAAFGWGLDAPLPADAERAKLRQRALDWLQSEVAVWAKVFECGPAGLKAKIRPNLQEWKDAFDLAGVRDESELAKLPEDERALCKTLWNKVDQLLARTQVRE
jgi:hypothetical protein